MSVRTGLHRRRMSDPPPRAAPVRIPPVRSRSLSLEALDLCSSSPSAALASLRFLVLSCLAELEDRLSGLERAATALDMLHSIQAEVRSRLPDLGGHLPDIGAHLPDIDELTSRLTLPDIDMLKALITGVDFSPLSYIPTLSTHLRRLQDHIADAELGFDFELPRPSFRFELPVLADLADVIDGFRADVDAFLDDIPSFPASLSFATPLPTLLSPSGEDEKRDVSRALTLASYGRRLIDYDDLPFAWRNNPFIQGGYRFIPLAKWPTLVASIFHLHNETLNIHTHLIPLILWGAAFSGLWVPPGRSTLVDLIVGFLTWLLAPLAWILPHWTIDDSLRYTPFSAFTGSNSTLSLPFGYFSSPYPPITPEVPADAAENLFTLFALACLACSVLWHVMAGCSDRRPMETCARIDYVGIGWLIATSIGTVVHHGYACAELAVDSTPLGHKMLHPSEVFEQFRELYASVLPDVVAAMIASVPYALSALWEATVGRAKMMLVYHPFGAACLLICFVCGVSGNILPFSEWFNRVENRLWRLVFFVGISFSALLPLAGIATLQGWDAMVHFASHLIPSLMFYFIGIIIYATHFPERFLGRQGSKGKHWLVRFVVDRCGLGSHAIWHVFIVFAVRAHRDGIRELRRVSAEGGCAAAGWA
ncbi:IZH family channel protein [Mycena chlorophos]|uniref:IZH family channel protein n=1 Tax=Mycena chlorophos TaxID=658473 RepID=A0A8H6WSN0_MYCCL|nr:IZH family channel protein [Mycena chlorophos]